MDPILVSADDAARMLGMSRDTFDARYRDGYLPAPRVFSRRMLRWSVEELRQWDAAGCPARDEWERMNRKLRMAR